MWKRDDAVKPAGNGSGADSGSAPGGDLADLDLPGETAQLLKTSPPPPQAEDWRTVLGVIQNRMGEITHREQVMRGQPTPSVRAKHAHQAAMQSFTTEKELLKAVATFYEKSIIEVTDVSQIDLLAAGIGTNGR
jgi:hypothetical protein